MDPNILVYTNRFNDLRPGVGCADPWHHGQQAHAPQTLLAFSRLGPSWRIAPGGAVLSGDVFCKSLAPSTQRPFSVQRAYSRCPGPISACGAGGVLPRAAVGLGKDTKCDRNRPRLHCMRAQLLRVQLVRPPDLNGNSEALLGRRRCCFDGGCHTRSLPWRCRRRQS